MATWSVGELVTAAKMNVYADAEPIHTGTTGMERWYTAGVIISGSSLSTGAPALATFTALPIISLHGGTIDRIAFEVTTGGTAGSKARVGIYAATSQTNIYPNALIVDGGEFDTTTTGIKSATISTVLTPNVRYWAAYLCGTAAPTIRTPINSMLDGSIIGISNSIGNAMPPWGLRVAQTYGALPGTFPASAGFGTTETPAGIFLRYLA
jgi:hypothetical protein